MKIYICRACDKPAKYNGIKFDISKKSGSSLYPESDLVIMRKKLKADDQWDAEHFGAWQERYLEQLACSKDNNARLNKMYLACKNPMYDVIISVGEDNKWALSVRKILVGLLLGAGIDPEQISVGNELSVDEIPVLKQIYDQYVAVKQLPQTLA